MKSLSEQRKERIMDAVFHVDTLINPPLMIEDELWAYLKDKHPTLTQKTIEDYARCAYRIIMKSDRN